MFNVYVYFVALLQGVCRQSAKAKLKNRHFNGAYRGSKPFFLALQAGLEFPVDGRSVEDVYYSQFQQQENSAKLQILHSTGHKLLKIGSKSNKWGSLSKFRKF